VAAAKASRFPDVFDRWCKLGERHALVPEAAQLRQVTTNGIKQPIKVVEYEGKLYIVDGHHRVLIAKRLGLAVVPVEEVTLPYSGYRTPADLAIPTSRTMAIWHFNCVLVPRSGLPFMSSVEDVLREGAMGLWRGTAAEPVRAALLDLGRPEATWNPTTERWGEEDATCVLLATIDGKVEDLRLRIDLRSSETVRLTAVCAICQRLDLVAVTESGDVVEASTVELMHASRRSPAARFVNEGMTSLPELALSASEPPAEDTDAAGSTEGTAAHDAHRSDHR
jgi:hypothetical protein